MGTITKFPIFNLYNVPEGLRKLADDIESGKIVADHCIICLSGMDSTLPDYKVFGKDLWAVTAVGILDAVKHIIIEGQKSSDR